MLPAVVARGHVRAWKRKLVLGLLLASSVLLLVSIADRRAVQSICGGLGLGAMSSQPWLWTRSSRLLRQTAEGIRTYDNSLPDAPCYIIPGTLFGPSNQLTTYQESLVLAKLLGCNLIVHGVINHYREARAVQHQLKKARVTLPPNETTNALVPFDVIFDRAHLQDVMDGIIVPRGKRQQPMRTHIFSWDEAVAAGWDKAIDTVLDFKMQEFDTYFKRLAKLTGIVLRNGDATRRWALKGKHFKCLGGELRQLRKFIADSRYIYVNIYDNMANEFMRWDRVPPLNMDTSECSKVFWPVASQLTKSQQLQASAHAWASKAFPGNSTYGSPGPFLAMHIRPYMDECMDIWKPRVFNETAASSYTCTTPGLHSGMAGEAKKQMLKHGLHGNKVFIMSHPDIRHTIDKFFKVEGLQPIYLHPHQVPSPILDSVAHHGDFAKVTLLSFLEQEVCRQAAVFVGTQVSSMSRMVLQLRLGTGGVDEQGVRSKLLGKNFNKPPRGG